MMYVIHIQQIICTVNYPSPRPFRSWLAVTAQAASWIYHYLMPTSCHFQQMMLSAFLSPFLALPFRYSSESLGPKKKNPPHLGHPLRLAVFASFHA